MFLAAMQTSMKTLVARLLLLKMEKRNRKIGRKQIILFAAQDQMVSIVGMYTHTVVFHFNPRAPKCEDFHTLRRF